ncbi:BTB/POZ domain-containing protein-like protein [Salvia divinorum]|uniref:BTB/POZ domain-containing protein-like protein n=1 Tax=Salvia divinorum TaxID=28513 RepID=A0ABD1GDN7_SALDI
MQCLFCNTPAEIHYGNYGGNAICLDCYKGAKSIILLINKTENDKSTNTNSFSPSNSYKGFVSVIKWMEERKRKEESLNEKITYLSGFASALRDQFHTDILLVPGDNEPSIPAHRALLATRSPIFRNMLESDQCKAPANETITLPELDHEQLEALIEFLYSGSLPKEKMEKHVSSLAIAADKYEIPFLQKVCEDEMVGSLNPSNALEILEISDTCNNQNLKDSVLSFIVRNMEDLVFSPSFDDFVLKNPHLSAHITRAIVTSNKKRKIGV